MPGDAALGIQGREQVNVQIDADAVAELDLERAVAWNVQGVDDLGAELAADRGWAGGAVVVPIRRAGGDGVGAVAEGEALDGDDDGALGAAATAATAATAAAARGAFDIVVPAGDVAAEVGPGFGGRVPDLPHAAGGLVEAGRAVAGDAVPEHDVLAGVVVDVGLGDAGGRDLLGDLVHVVGGVALGVLPDAADEARAIMPTGAAQHAEAGLRAGAVAGRDLLVELRQRHPIGVVVGQADVAAEPVFGQEWADVAGVTADLGVGRGGSPFVVGEALSVGDDFADGDGPCRRGGAEAEQQAEQGQHRGAARRAYQTGRGRLHRGTSCQDCAGSGSRWTAPGLW